MSAAPIETVADREKRAATLAARCALVGIQLHRTAHGTWIVMRWSLAKEVADAEIESWLQRLEGRRGST